MAAAKSAQALCLVDVPAHGLRAGQVLEASADLVKALATAGAVDPHKDAVGHARGAGAAIVRSRIELEAEQAAAARASLQAQVDQLQAEYDKAEGEAKNALAEQLLKLRAQLGQA